MRLDKILVPTDFSETADHAQAQAVELAATAGASLELFHVVEPYGELPAHLMGVVREYIEKVEHDAVQTLIAKTEAIGTEIDVCYSTSQQVAPFEAISAKVETLQPDLVVMGTHGRRGFERFMLGSVAEKLLRAAPVDVLTLSLEAPLVGRPRGFTRILVPVDFSEYSQRALEKAFTLLGDDGMIHVVHVVANPIYPVFYPGPVALPVQVDPDLPDKIRTHLDRWLSGRKVELAIREGDAIHEVLEVAKESRADLIVMGTRGLRGLSHALMGSVTENVVRRATVPVLTVH